MVGCPVVMSDEGFCYGQAAAAGESEIELAEAASRGPCSLSWWVWSIVVSSTVSIVVYYVLLPSNTLSRRPHWRKHMTELWMHVVSKQWVAALQRTYAHPNEAKYRNSLNDTVLHLAVCSAAGPGGNPQPNTNTQNNQNNHNNNANHNNNSNNNNNNNHHQHLNHSLNYNPPLPFVRALVRAYPEACAVRNESGCTPLHLAVVRGSSVDVIRTVLEAHVGAVAMRNNMGDTPLALLGWTRPERAVVRWAIEEYQWQHQRRIMGQKHAGQHSLNALHNHTATNTLVPPPPEALTRIWNSACLLVKAAASCRDNCKAAAAQAADDEAEDAATYTAFQDDVGDAYDHGLFAFAQHSSSSEAEPHKQHSSATTTTTATPSPTFRMVHACCTVPCCPLDIVRLAMQVHPEQLSEMDEFHRLPLHWAIESAFERARNSQRQRQRHLHRAMTRMSCGAGSGGGSSGTISVNVIRSSQYHSHVSSPYYHGGHDLLDDRLIQIVLDANPGAVMRRDGKSGLYPFMMLAVGEYASLTWSYRALRACPELERIFGAGSTADMDCAGL